MPQRLHGFEAIAVVAAINVKGEVVAVHCTQKSITAESFVTFLKILFSKYRHE